MSLLKFFTASFLFLIILTSCSNEPESNPVLTVYKGTIKGFVYDATTNAPIYYAKISTQPPTKETYTGADGEFILSDILVGDYIVDAHRDGYDNDTTFVTIQHKDTVSTNFLLQDFSIYLDYYPLEIGDYWEYWSGNSPGFSAEVISDTMIAGKVYRIIKERSLVSQNIGYRYERVDEYNALVYRYFLFEEKEMIIDSLPAKQGQRFTSNMFLDWDVCSSYCSNIEERNIFGEIRKLRYLSHDCGQDLPWYQILKGIGLYSYGWPRPPGGYTLKYAIIKGVEYGER
ncbi:MAG TPA: carboxypeptidase regulatory-like domain-containing protein [Ignavibacteriaceae bacterium]|nr:carboxypeptidase regulatory-like domain-containing protein [Ignavibacteriaceae bacterium]